MSVKKSITICRILVALLIFNIAMPMAVAGVNDGNTALICTSAGFIKVNVDDFYGDSSSEEQAHSFLQHCTFCTFADSDSLFNADHLGYQKPDSELISHYESILPLSPAKAIIKHALLRAPPAYI